MYYNILKQIQLLRKLIRLYHLIIALKQASPYKSKNEVAARIRQIAVQEQIDPELAIRVAVCESGLNPFSINYNANGTIDRGVFQWNDFYHPEVTDKCAFNLECATRAFCKAVREGHLDWWNASRHCWRK